MPTKNKRTLVNQNTMNGNDDVNEKTESTDNIENKNEVHKACI